MKIARLFLPGRFEDAYVYMGNLLVITEQRTLLVYYLKQILDNLEDQYPDLAPVIAMMFANNNWRHDRLFKSFLKNPKIADIILKTFDKFPLPYLEVNKEITTDAMRTEDEIHISDQVLLDFFAYNRRLYIGASSGFYHLDVEWEDNRKSRSGQTFIRGKPLKRLDTRCISISAGFGAVNASCGREGLFAALDEFRWMHKDNGHIPKLEQHDSRSLRTNWSDYNLVNYSSYENPLFLGNTYERIDNNKGREQERRVLTSIGETHHELGYFFGSIYERYDVQKSSVQYSFNAGNTFFVHTHHGQFYSLNILFPLNREPEMRFNTTFKGETTRILSAHELGVGSVIETDNRILLFSDRRWWTVHNGEAMSIRTFPRSEAYRNIVAITLEEGLLLVGIFDDEKFLQQRPERFSWAP